MVTVVWQAVTISHGNGNIDPATDEGFKAAEAKLDTASVLEWFGLPVASNGPVAKAMATMIRKAATEAMAVTVADSGTAGNVIASGMTAGMARYAKAVSNGLPAAIVRPYLTRSEPNCRQAATVIDIRDGREWPSLRTLLTASGSRILVSDPASYRGIGRSIDGREADNLRYAMACLTGMAIVIAASKAGMMVSPKAASAMAYGYGHKASGIPAFDWDMS